MFLTKKNAAPSKQQNKPKNSKALGGWDDDESEQVQHQHQNKNNSIPQPQNINKSNSTKTNNDVDLLNIDTAGYVGIKNTNDVQEQKFTKPVQIKSGSNNNNKKKQALAFYDSKQLQEMQNITLECKVIENILAPGGIRVKQNQAMLNQFVSEAKNLDIAIVGSLLICYLYNNNVDFQVKARSMYAIQHLCKKSVQYSVYFKMHIDPINNCPVTEEHSDNFLKIKKNLLGTLGALVINHQERKQLEQLNNQNGIDFVDPGYSQPLQSLGVVPKKSSTKTQGQQGPVKKFISPQQAKNKQKKQFQGPNSKKAENKNTNLLDLNTKNGKKDEDLLNIGQLNKGPSSNKAQFDLLGQPTHINKQPQTLTFDQLIQKEKRKKSNQFDFRL